MPCGSSLRGTGVDDGVGPEPGGVGAAGGGDLVEELATGVLEVAVAGDLARVDVDLEPGTRRRRCDLGGQDRQAAEVVVVEDVERRAGGVPGVRLVVVRDR